MVPSSMPSTVVVSFEAIFPFTVFIMAAGWFEMKPVDPVIGCGNGPASHFHPTGIRRFRKQQRALRELKCPRLRIERKNGVRTHPSEREISEFQFGA